MSTSTRSVTLIGADGTRRTLVGDDNAPYQLKSAAGLWGVAPVAHTSRRMGSIPGERLDQVSALPRTLVVPVQVYGATEAEVDSLLGDLGAILRPGADVRILYQRPTGEQREITAVYLDGAAALAAAADHGYLRRHVPVPLIFKAYWPYWRQVADAVRTSGVTTFNDAFGAGSNLVLLDNRGDVDCWPEWLINGHTDYVEALNLTSGKMWRSAEIIPAGSTLRVDTDPRSRGVWVDSEYLWTLDEFSEPWALRPGVNWILVRGSTTNGTQTIGNFEIRWRRNYESC